MTLRELVHSASIEIKTHKIRSALTCLSLSIGVAATIYTLAETSGMNRRLQQHIEITGPGRLEITKKDDYIPRGLSKGLTAEDAEAIRQQMSELYMVYPLARGYSARLQFEDFNDRNIMIEATTPEWSKRDWVYTLEGRFINDDDLRNASRVCVIIQSGGWVKKPFWAKFFPEQALDKVLKRENLVGKQVLLQDHQYRVIGVLREPPKDRDPRWFQSYWGQSGTVLIPITTYEHFAIPAWNKGTPSQVEQIQVETGNERTAGSAMRRLRFLLLNRHRGEEDFEIKDFRERIQGAMKRVKESVAAIMVIGIVAILAGGIGIMNVTLATVFSRIREIGIRRALGATRGDVVLQFVTEAMILGFLSGSAGTPIGIAAAKYMAFDPDRVVLPGIHHIALALGISLGTGLLFSLYPAWKASRFDPIEALRYE